MLQELSDEITQMGVKINIAKTNIMVVDNAPINVNNMCSSKMLKDTYTCIPGATLLPQEKEPRQRDTMKKKNEDIFT